jgi:PIN domain nuclease of toxin-antitoxin system
VVRSSRTHVFLWYLEASPRLAAWTRQLLDAATAAGEPILISAVMLVELRYQAENGTLTEADVDAVKWTTSFGWYVPAGAGTTRSC